MTAARLSKQLVRRPHSKSPHSDDLTSKHSGRLLRAAVVSIGHSVMTLDKVTTHELRVRLESHALTAPVPDANFDLLQTALDSGRELHRVRLHVHGDFGLGLPTFQLELQAPGNRREVLALSPGPKSLLLLHQTLGDDGLVETDLVAVGTSGTVAKIAAAAGRAASGRNTGVTDPAERQHCDAADEERIFNRILAAAEPTTTGDLLRATIDVVIEEVQAERGIVALAHDGILRPEIARLSGARNYPDAAGEIPRRVFARVVEKKAPVFVEDVLDPTLSLVPSRSVLDKHIQSFMAAPLLDDGEVIGILYVDRRDHTTRFGDRARGLFVRVAGRIAQVLARLASDIEPISTDDGDGDPLAVFGRSPAMRAVAADVRRLAGHDVDVLILGETGTGKELVCRTLHRLGRRREKRFEAINCAALPETLLDSVLFGHTRGAFTGADRERRGLFVDADHGTLFLDEIGDMPAALQAKILRTLEYGEVRPIGSTRVQKVDVRLLAATHRDLAAAIDSGEVREDFYYRLTAAATIRVPPLRDRREDIPLLADRFAVELSAKHDLARRRFSPSADERLRGHSWPGNVRELRNVVLHTVLNCASERIEPDDIIFAGRRPVPARLAGDDGSDEVVPFRDHLRDYLARAYRLSDGNVSRVAEMLQEPRSTVRDWLIKCDVFKPRRRPS